MSWDHVLGVFIFLFIASFWWSEMLGQQNLFILLGLCVVGTTIVKAIDVSKGNRYYDYDDDDW